MLLTHAAFRCRPASGAVHRLGGIPVAVRRAVLPAADVPNRADVDRVRLHDHRVHRRTLRGHLPPAEGAHHVQPAARRQDDRPRLAGGRRRVAALPAAHAHLLLPRRPGVRRPDRRVARLRHPARVAAADVLHDPGVDDAAVRRADVRHDRPLRPHRAHRPPLRQLAGNPGRRRRRRRDGARRRRDPAAGDDVDDVRRILLLLLLLLRGHLL